MKNASIFILQWVAVGLAIALIILLFRNDMTEPVTGPAANLADPSSANVQSQATLKALQTGFSSAVRQAAPAVVYVFTSRLVTEQSHPFLRDRVFREFLGSDDDRPQRRLETGLGSGVIVSPQGYILTNNHVIEDADQIQVQLADGRGGVARVVGSDPDTDLAILKLPVDQLPVIKLGLSSALQVGDVVLAIGNPFGVGQTVTMGITSATGRQEIGVATFENFIQTDAAINPGNSGGALINTRGQLVGINTAVFGTTGYDSPIAQGIGFAIPIEVARDVMQQIISQGFVTRGWLGIEVQDIDPRLALALDIAIDQGALVRRVQRGGPADEAGLKSGDILIAIGSHQLKSARDALNHIVKTTPGDRVNLKVRRAGRVLTLPAVPKQRPG